MTKPVAIGYIMGALAVGIVLGHFTGESTVACNPLPVKVIEPEPAKDEAQAVPPAEAPGPERVAVDGVKDEKTLPLPHRSSYALRGPIHHCCHTKGYSQDQKGGAR